MLLYLTFWFNFDYTDYFYKEKFPVTEKEGSIIFFIYFKGGVLMEYTIKTVCNLT